MPWCGLGETTSGLWWLMPLLGIAFMTVMLFVCFRGFGCMPWRRHRSSELADLQRDVQGLKEDVRKLLHQPS